MNRYNSNLNLLKSLEESILDFIDLKSNYVIDCILCGKCYIVYIDLENVKLVELCSIRTLEIENDDKNENK